MNLKVGNYQIGETIGSGSFGKVKSGIHVQTGQKVALKFINRHKVSAMDMVVRIKREINYLKFLRHPHIIKLYEVITTPTDIIMVMEFSSAELFDYIVKQGKLEEDQARKFFQQIISAVEYCHRHKIVHRDLKPENLLLDQSQNVKIADFGLCNIIRDGDFLQTSCGSPNYASPEVISGKLYAGPEVDIWSCGVILYVMLCGKLPFDDESIPNLFKKICSGNFKVPSFLSIQARELIGKMLTVDPTLRITIPDIRKTPWFSTNLPEYLLPLPEIPESITFDDTIIDEISKKMGIEHDIVYESLQNPENTRMRVTYQLLVDNRLLSEKAANEKNRIQGFFIPSPPALQIPSNYSSCNLVSPTIQPLSSSISKSGLFPSKRTKLRPKWYYGIRSKNDPNSIMLEIYSSLIRLGMKWKTISNYHIRVLYSIKFDIALYKISGDKYLVDFKSMDSMDIYRFYEATRLLIGHLAMN